MDPTGPRLRRFFKDDAMSRYQIGMRGVQAACLVSVGLIALSLFALAGCTTATQSRAKAEEENERDRYPIETVGEKTTVGNPEPIALGGVGIVTDLPGTGGPSPADDYRAMLEEQLHKEGIKNTKELLNSPNNALVVVEAQINPGAAKGDPIDVVVMLPPGSRATSLRGGHLYRTRLYNYDFSKNLSPQGNGANRMLRGHALAVAEGSILVGMGDGDEALRVKQGRIWGGAKCLSDQPLGLIMNPDQQFARVASQVADQINASFVAGGRGPIDEKIAVAQNKLAVALKVPPQYRLNLPRYLRVVRMVPMVPNVNGPLGQGADKRSYRERLAMDLLDPAYTVVAALRLEALGARSIPLFKKGLLDKHPLVRFCCAESLAYLGSPACGEELAKAVVEQPLFRSFGLTALASMDEAVSHMKLRELLQSSRDDETRYGAFRALRALDEKDPVLAGEFLNDSFWLHRIASQAPPLVHVSSTRRAEVVLFGPSQRLKPPFSLLAGEFSVTATTDDTAQCTIRRIPLHGARPLPVQTSFELEDVLRAMADLGAQYPEVVALLQQVESIHGLTCRVRCDAMPQAVSVYDLVEAGKNGTGGDLFTGNKDLGVTPTLYDMGISNRGSRETQRQAQLRDNGSR
jgi:flagellar basal body P-ring protein FlgI